MNYCMGLIFTTCSFQLVFYSPIDHEADRPTLYECIRFQGKEGIINIPQEIGISYHDFGILLLGDRSGARIDAIAHKHKDDAERINKEILKQWIAGGGKRPVTWNTLIETLYNTELSTLAKEIESVKISPLMF